MSIHPPAMLMQSDAMLMQSDAFKNATLLRSCCTKLNFVVEKGESDTYLVNKKIYPLKERSLFNSLTY
ncbi:hypothetical protein NIES4075_22180 [Tolypothrix sp. NIES-4075]|nr:hypothetical protein NIES4075_22180 [Tolypothrix sp. NIES-4075]